jgi:hypothetical protein
VRKRTERDRFIMRTGNRCKRWRIGFAVKRSKAWTPPDWETVTCANCLWEEKVPPEDASRTFWTHHCNGVPDARRRAKALRSRRARQASF